MEGNKEVVEVENGSYIGSVTKRNSTQMMVSRDGGGAGQVKGGDWMGMEGCG